MIDGDDLELFERSLEHAMANHSASLDEALVELGWRDALASDAHGAVSRLFTLQGAANATSSALDDVLAGSLDRSAETVVLPRIGQWNAPAATRGGRLTVDGITTASVRERATALAVAAVDDTHVLFAIDSAALAHHPIGGVDPSLELVAVDGEITGAKEVGPVDWRAAVATGQLALGHELVGASRRMLELAREHALDRIQFGQPIAMFQAVRHRLADTLVAIEAAEASLDAAWLDGSAVSAAMAKATAGRAARTTARHCQQVLAGIGFTTEHPFHRYVRRVLLLEHLLGSTRSLTRELGDGILATGQLPALVPL
jgi:hypothetical protein